ncbi:hypothetical protein [Micromonospora sp. CP22]|uniref:hypothetical protein n=1 Tax=Micromonospora sp. CP22 TaxID=2580517 RepID=UPI0012BB5517|nr:hypothetical protein [Micromonospora sp. CP22]MTK05180.1 hypothetical protein [Micromonospora sp. CP22]
MDIWFGDDETAELCSRAARLTARWGAAGGRAVGRKLVQIEAAATVEALRALPGGLRRDATDDTWMINVDGVAIIKFKLDDRTGDGAGTVRVLAVSDQPAGGTRR